MRKLSKKMFQPICITLSFKKMLFSNLLLIIIVSYVSFATGEVLNEFLKDWRKEALTLIPYTSSERVLVAQQAFNIMQVSQIFLLVKSNLIF